MHPLFIGSVIRVGNGQVEVRVEATDPHIMYEGEPYQIGRPGSYITISTDDRTLVGFVTGIGHQDATGGGKPLVVMTAQLLGELRERRFIRGVNAFPLVGDEVRVAGRDDFDAVFGGFDERLAGGRGGKYFSLGRFALDTGFDVKVLGTEFLAKHAAILGNTGSGKSCTTARILQEVLRLGRAQVVLFDMHGEYRSAFCDRSGSVNPNVTCLGADDLVLPYWLLKYEELETLFVDRSNPLNVGTQISFLRTALMEFKQDAARALGLTKTLTLDTPVYFSLEKLKTYAENLNEARFVLNDDHLAFSQLALRSLTPQEQQTLLREQRCRFNRGHPQGETPHPLYFGKLVGLIDRIDTMFHDRRFSFLLKPMEQGLESPFFRKPLNRADPAERPERLMHHLIKLLTGHVEPRRNLTIVDLSGIPFEIVDITVAVLTRLLFDLNFWAPAARRRPLLLVFEEAHHYIPRTASGRHFARTAVERVAKEGRKYGLSALVISQRPAELSETVLSQCNSFVVMRMSNPEDQRYVSKVVGDHFAGILQMVPMLRPGEAYVIGDGVPMPMRTLVTMPEPAPQSSDMDFFGHWAAQGAESDLDQVIDDWRRQDRRRGETGTAEAPGPDRRHAAGATALRSGP